MRKSISILLVLTMIMSLLGGCSSDNVESQPSEPKSSTGKAKYVMKISHPTMPDSPRDLGAQKIKEVVERETAGQVEVQIYPSQQLGPQAEMVQGLQNGNIEMQIGPIVTLGTVQPLMGVMDIPFMYPNTNEGMIKFLGSDAAKAFMELTEPNGIINLDLWFGGLKNFTANKPLKKVDDFKGLKFRVMPAPILVEQFKALGAIGLNIDFGEVYSSLQTGAIDGQENPYDVIFEQKYQEVQDYLTETRHASIVLGVSVSKKWWDGLPADIQEAVVKGVKEGGEVCVAKLLENEKNYKEEIKKAGVNIIELTDEEWNSFEPVRDKVTNVFLEKYGDAGKAIYDKMKEELQL